MFDIIKKLNYFLSKREKKILILIGFSSIFVSFLETLSISLVMFFASIATNVNHIFNNKYFSWLYHYLHFKNTSNFIIFFGLILITFYFFRAFVLIFNSYFINRFSEGRYKNFTYRFFKNYLNFDYIDFTSMDMVTVNKFIFVDARNLSQMLNSLITIFSEFLTVLFIYTSLIFVNWKLTLALSFVLCVKVFFIIKTFSGKLEAAGKTSQNLNIILGKTFGESFWNFKMIKLISNEKQILKKFDKAVSSFIKANILNNVLQNIPRLILETIGFSTLIGVIVYIVYMYNNASQIIPVMSMYAFAFYRFLPSINKIIAAYNQISFLRQSLYSVQNNLNYSFEDLGNKQIAFKQSLVLKNLSFKYEQDKKILNNVNLSINKGDRVALIGESGGGKSTIVDVIMGLYKPFSGAFFVDGKQVNSVNLRSWRNKIGYIPQDIYLFNGTVAENVVFGRIYNEKHLDKVLKQANIYDFLVSQKGVNTIVGESGIKLSGGQKQRIAIARALYSNPEVLVLDEATSALDDKTEAKIMDEVYKLGKDKTIIVIAHRLGTIRRCDKVYRIEKGNVLAVQNISELYFVENKTKEVSA